MSRAKILNRVGVTTGVLSSIIPFYELYTFIKASHLLTLMQSFLVALKITLSTITLAYVGYVYYDIYQLSKGTYVMSREEFYDYIKNEIIAVGLLLLLLLSITIITTLVLYGSLSEKVLMNDNDRYRFTTLVGATALAIPFFAIVQVILTLKISKKWEIKKEKAL